MSCSVCGHDSAPISGVGGRFCHACWNITTYENGERDHDYEHKGWRDMLNRQRAERDRRVRERNQQ